MTVGLDMMLATIRESKIPRTMPEQDTQGNMLIGIITDIHTLDTGYKLNFIC